jgi:hypothetical protein
MDAAFRSRFVSVPRIKGLTLVPLWRSFGVLWHLLGAVKAAHVWRLTATDPIRRVRRQKETIRLPFATVVEKPIDPKKRVAFTRFLFFADNTDLRTRVGIGAHQSVGMAGWRP